MPDADAPMTPSRPEAAGAATPPVRGVHAPGGTSVPGGASVVRSATATQPHAMRSAPASVTPPPPPPPAAEAAGTTAHGPHGPVDATAARGANGPPTASGVDCGVIIDIASNNADVSIDTDGSPQTKIVTFAGSDWNTPQTVTVTAASDGDGVDDVATISHSRSGACSGGFFGTPTLPSVTANVNDDETPAAAIASPTILTAATLNNATLTVSLERSTYASGVTAAGFELVTEGIAGAAVSLASATATPGGTSATLTLASSGTGVGANATLAVKVLAAAHAGDADLTTGAISVLQGADTAPTFGSSGLSTNRYPRGVAIAPFQVPAATGGNGAITYTATGLPAGLKFDATGTDAGGCTASDFPTGTAATWATAPRTVCGTPTGRDVGIVYIHAHDADSNRANSDRATLHFTISIFLADITATTPSPLTEGGLNGATVTVTLTRTFFASGVTAASFELVTAIPNVAISGVSGGAVNTNTATLTLAFTGDFDAIENLAVKVIDAAHDRDGDIPTGAVSVFPTGVADTAPTFGSSGLSTNRYPRGVAIAPFQVPAATGGNGAITYTATGLPAGLKFDATGTDAGGCTASDFPTGTAATWATAPRTVCGTPTGRDVGIVYIHAHDADSNRANSDRATLHFTISIFLADITATTPSPLTEGGLNGATVTVTLTRTFFASGVTASSFELVTAIPNVSISGVSGGAVNTNTATLTLAFTGDFDAIENLAVKVLDTAHDRDGDIPTGAVSVFPTGVADTAPTFGGATVGNQIIPFGGAIAPVQIPAASGGNGAIAYTVSNLPPGLKFDATGTDAGGCTASDFPAGTAVTWATAPRTICGTPTSAATHVVSVHAHDADANRANSDRASLTVRFFFFAARIQSTTPATLTEGNLLGATITVSLGIARFASGVTASSFELVTEIPNVSISGVSSVSSGDSAATLTLAFTGDFDATETLAVRVLAAAHNRDGDLTTDAVSVTPTDTTPAFAAPQAQTLLRGAPIAPFQAPAATGGNGDVTYTVAGLPAGLKFDATGTDAGGCSASDFPPGTADIWATAPRTICGTPTRNATSVVLVSAEDEDGDTVQINLRIVVTDPAYIAATSPRALTEASLRGATVRVALNGIAFSDGVAASSFELVTDIPGLSVSQVSGGAAGSGSATLTLAFTGDFAAVETLAVTVLAAAHTGGSDFTTGTVRITPAPGIVLSPTALALHEEPGGTNAHVGTYTVALAADPTPVIGGACTVTLEVASNNADVAIDADATPLTRRLTFDAASWSAPQTVTVVAASDSDGNDDAAAISHRRVDSCTAGFFGSPTLPSVNVTVDDDEPAAATIAAPGALTASTLNTATLTVTLERTTYASGVTAASFELVTGATGNLAIASATATDGGTSATLTLSYSGTLAANATLAVKVLAAAHAGYMDLTTGAIDVLQGTDTAPTFGAGLSTNRYPRGVAIAPFQVPAATGGNGAISYTATGLPAGLKFDATGTDAGGCTASDFPAGTAATWATAPRTICGTPTGRDVGIVAIHAHDADSNRANSDRATLDFTISIFLADITATTPSPLTEGGLNGATVTVTLTRTSYAGGVTAASFELITAIPNVSISGVSGGAVNTTTATLTLAFTGDFDAVENLAVKVLDAAHDRDGDIPTGAVSVSPTGVADTAPTFGGATVGNQIIPFGGAIVPVQIPAASGGNGAISYTVSNLPPGLKFDATGTNAGGCAASDFPTGTAASWATAPRTICGTPTSAATHVVSVHAHDADANRANSDRASLTVRFFFLSASIQSTTPATLTEGNLHGATITVSLGIARFASGVTASSFELVTEIPNVSISGVSSVSSGDSAATLTLAFTGDFAAIETLAVRVLAAAHNRDGDLTTNAVSVFPTGVANTAPTFGSGSVAAKRYREGMAIAPFQIPAATGGNGAIDYSATNLPAGLKFDATGTDAGGCTMADFPPGTADTWATAPRTVCGTPATSGGGVFAGSIGIHAHDADSDRSNTDRATLSVQASTYRLAIASTTPSPLTEGDLDGATIGLSLRGAAFADGVDFSSFELVTTIPDLAITKVVGATSGGDTATLTLSFSGDFNTAETLAVKIVDAAHNRSGDLTTGAVSVPPTDTAPAFGAAPAREFVPGVAIAPFQVPAATGGNGVAYSVVGLPAGLKFDATGSDADGCAAADFPIGTAASWATAPRTVCGTPVRNVVSIVVVSAEDEDGDTASVQFRITVAGPEASIASTSPAALAEGGLHGATLTVSLARTDFAAGLSAARFALVTTIPNLSISGVAATGGGAVAVGATEAVLTLAFTGDFGGTRTLAVRVLAAAHSQSGNLVTGTVDVTANAGVTVGKESLALNEPPNAGASGTYTLVLDAAPPSTCSLTVGVTGGNADVAASPSSVDFTDANWDTPQTVTVTASADADSSADADTLAHAVTASTCTGYPTTLSIGSVAVTVADADVGVTIAPGPAALTESNLHGATLTLTLDNTTFAAGAQAAGAGAFSLVSTIPTLTITQVSGVTSGGTTATLTLGFTGDFRGQPTLAVRVPATTHAGTGALTSNAATVTANAGVTVSESSLSLDEDPGTGGSAHEGTYTVVLDSPPTGCALVRIDVASSHAGVTVSPAMLTFRRTGAVQLWNAPQTVMATAAQDDNGADVAATVSHSVGLGCSAAGYIPGMAIDGVAVAVDDDETPGILFDADPGMANDQSGPLALVEDDASDASKEYTVRLATQPTQDVTMTLTSADTGAVAVGDTDGNTPGDQSTLTFTASNWATAQTVTLTAQGDDDGGNESVAVTHAAATASASEYTNVSAGLTANVADDDTPALTLSATTLSVPEQGSATYTVRLATLPVGGNVTVAVSGAGDGITVDTDGATGGDQDTLTFTAGSWATAQTVTVAAADDQDAASERVTLTHTATGADYGGVSADLEATAADDAPQVALALSSSSIGESGGEATVTATLDRQSSVAVTVTVAAAPVSPAVAGDFTLSSANTLTFAANATASAGTVTVVAVDNTTDAPDKAVTVTGTASDSLGLAQDPSSMTLTITDDDAAPGVTLSLNPASIAESGGTSTVSAALSHPSSAATTVTVTAVSGAFTVPSGAAGYIVIPAGGTTAATDTVTVTAVDNDVDAPDNPVTVTATVANDQGAGSVTDATLTLEDDEATPTVTLSVSPASISENGATATVRATLSGKSSQPTTVTVTAQAGVFTVASGAGATIILAAGQTTTTDTATITAVDNDVDAADNPVTVAATAGNGHGVGALTGASLTLTDDDVAAIVTSPVTSAASRVRTSEDGSTAAVAVSLATEPTGDVRMDVASSDTAQGTVSPAMLTFTATNWNTAQTVTLTGVDDSPGTADGSQSYTVSLTVDTANTADANYDALSAVTIYAVNADDELGLDVGAVSGQATEAGGTATFTVRLVTDPALVTQASQAVTVSVTSRDAGEGTASPPSLAFTAGSSGTWSTSQTVTVTGVDDAIDDGDVAWDVRLDTSSATGSDYAGVPDVDVAMTTTDDDDAPAVTLSVSPGTIAESGGTATVTAVLSRASGAATTLTVAAVSGLYTPGADATIVIAAGATTSTDTATVAAVDDDVHQGSAGRTTTVTATVANDRAAADATTMTVTGAALALTDDDAPPGATLSLNPASTAENGGTSAVSAALSHPSGAATTVTVTAVSGFYTVGSDATIVIAAGATTAASDTAAITAVDNDVDEPNRTATVTATLANDRGAGSVTGATLTLEDDEATPTVTLSVSPASVSENGGAATVRATLSGKSSQPTTVTVTAQANVFTVASGAGATIILAAGQTTTTDTATITAVDNDVDAADNPVTVAAAAGNGHGVGAVTGASLTLTDDDVAGIVTSPVTSAASRVRTSEDGSTAAVAVSLATEPTGDVRMDVASSDTAQGTVSPAMLTFTSTNWSTAQTVTLTGVDDNPDAVDGSQTYTVSLTVDMASTADSNYDALSAVTIYAVNADDELGLDVGAVSGPATEAGGTATFTVRLVTDPALVTQASQAVTVSVTSRDAGEGTASPPSLAFTAGSSGTWSTSQTVTVTGMDDAIDDGDVVWDVRLDTSSANGSDYDAVPDVDVAVTTTDNDDAPGVTLSVSPGSISENGGTATVTAVLSRASSEATTVTVTGVTGLYTPGSDATIVIPAGATTSTDTATIAAVDDAVHQGSAGRQVTVTATVANDRAAADGTTMSVTGAALALTDDEAPPGATLSLNPATVAESGAGNTSAVSATLSRASAVATTVTVTVASGFYTVGSDATIVIPAGATTAASDTASITAVDNATDEPDRTPTVTATLANDRGAGSVTGATLTITDDDAAPTVALSVSPASIAEDGGTAAVGAVLSHPSSEPTTVTVTAVANAYTVAPGAGGTIVVAAGQTTTTDTATITAVDNAVDAADNVVTVAGTATNGHGVGAVTGASLTLTDDDVAAIVTSPQTSATSRVRTSEDGSTAAVDVVLATEPTGDVRMDVASTDTAQGTVSPAMLTFTATNWSTAQTVTLTGVDDNPGVADGSQNYTVTLTVDTANTADASYGALSAATIHARNLDDEAGVEVSIASGTTLMTTEGGGTATFTVRLLSAPEGDVTVPLRSSDPGEGTVSPSSLVFTAANATTAQTVVVTGVDDEVDDGDEPYRIGTGDPSSPDDPAYNALGAGDVADVSVVNRDDDTTPTVTLALTPSTIDEDGTASTVATVSENGGVATVTATLSHPSDEATTVTVAATAVDPAVAGDFTLSTETTLTIAALATASTGTVTVAAVDNAVDAPDKEVRVSGTAANARASADSAVMAVTAATLTIADDDERGLAFAGAGAEPEDFEGVLDVAEGGEVAYTVALASAPVGTVGVAVAAGNPSLSVAPERLTFTAEDWNTPQTVTVAAQDDGDDYVNEASWVSHTASGGGYDEVSGSLPVSVAGETTVRVKAAAGTTTWVIEGRRVVVTVAAGVPEGIEVDFAGVGSGPAEAEPAMTVEGPAAVDAKVVARAADDGFNLGPEEVRTVVDVEVQDLAGVGLCLPVAAAVVAGLPEGDTGRLRLLRYDEDAWGVVGEEYRPAAGTAPGRVCAGGVDSFSPFASGYVDTRPVLDAAGLPEAFVWEVDEPVEPVTLPLATGGDCAGGDCRGGEGLDYRLAPQTLPPGLAFDQDGSGSCGRPRTLCGTPTEEFAVTDYTWTATDVDGHRDTLTFTIEVEPARAKARARLKRLNESILPEVSRASWDSAMAAVAGRLESAAGGGASGASGGGLAAALAGFVQANEQALEDDASWKETLSGQSFAVALGGGESEGAGPGAGLGRSVVVWGAGDRRHLSRDEPWLGWSGDLSAFHLGADAAFGPGLTGGLGVSWFESRMDYVDRSDDEPVEGVHRSRMASVQPYLGWSSGEGSRLWASLGYGSGEIEIEDEALLERYGRQRSGSRLLAAAAGGAVRLTPAGATRVELKGEGQATRYEVEDNGDGRDDLIEGLAVETQRLRVAVQGSREYVLAGGGRVTPSAELGVRWDGGDGATGAGGEVRGGVSWTGPGRLVLEAGGRWLVVHRSGVEEWGLTGGLRLAPRANGRGLSLSVAPGWGEAGSGVSRLWEEGMAGRGETAEVGSGAVVEAEVGYGVGAFGGFGVATPYTRFGQAREERRYGLGWRLGRGPGDGFALDLGVWRRERATERPEHGVGLDLRLRW